MIFQYLFTDQNNDPAVDKAARDAAAKARSWLDESITKRKAQASRVETPQPDDVLGRCLALQNAGVPGMDDLGIRNNLLGLFVGAIPTTSKCCTQALDELLKRPAELAKARKPHGRITSPYWRSMSSRPCDSTRIIPACFESRRKITR